MAERIGPYNGTWRQCRRSVKENNQRVIDGGSYPCNKCPTEIKKNDDYYDTCKIDPANSNHTIKLCRACAETMRKADALPGTPGIVPA